MELRKDRNPRLLQLRTAVRRVAQMRQVGGESVADVDARGDLRDLRERDAERDFRLRIDLTPDHRVRQLAVEIAERRRRFDRPVTLNERESRGGRTERTTDVDPIAG